MKMYSDSLIEKQAGAALEFTGERMVPEGADTFTFWEHIYRYQFASRFVRNKRVLDVACGEGYGASALSKANAQSVIGVDISEEAVRHARNKYGIDARLGNAENLPLASNSIDLIVSFETIEHIADQEAFLKECVRVLVPGGKLIISTPNKDAYGEDGSHNPFHCCELTESEFVGLLSSQFSYSQLFTQCPISAAWWGMRSFVAKDSAWLRLRGFYRFRGLLQRALCSHIKGEVKEEYRQSSEQMILLNESIFSSLVNPYSVRSQSQWQREMPLYFIAVATL